MPSCGAIPRHKTEGETVQTIASVSVLAIITADGTVVAAWISRRGQPPRRDQGNGTDR
jgi:hypothetical protein